MLHLEGKNILNFVKELPNDNKCKEYLATYKCKMVLNAVNVKEEKVV